jgi:uncharacterized protein YgiM (DUF1202 family)
MKKIVLLCFISLIVEYAFCSGILELSDNGAFASSIADHYVEIMDRSDNGAKFLRLSDSYVAQGQERDWASMLALNDYDPLLAAQIYAEIKTSDKSRRDTMSDVRLIMALAAIRIYKHYRPDVINTNNSNATSSDFVGSTYAYVTADLNMRSGPSPETPIITVLHKNNRVEIISSNENTQRWIKVKFNEYIGFINVGYLKK